MKKTKNLPDRDAVLLFFFLSQVIFTDLLRAPSDRCSGFWDVGMKSPSFLHPWDLSIWGCKLTPLACPLLGTCAMSTAVPP